MAATDKLLGLYSLDQDRPRTQLAGVVHNGQCGLSVQVNIGADQRTQTNKIAVCLAIYAMSSAQQTHW